MEDQIVIPEWILIKSETRLKLRDLFGIPKSGTVETVTDTSGIGRVVTDGHTHRDLEAVTIQKLCEFLGIQGSTDNIHELLKQVVVKIETPIIDAAVEELKVPEPIIEIPINNPVLAEVIESISKDLNPPEGADKLKCEKCEFRTASKIAMKMHFGRFHKDNN